MGVLGWIVFGLVGALQSPYACECAPMNSDHGAGMLPAAWQPSGGVRPNTSGNALRVHRRTGILLARVTWYVSRSRRLPRCAQDARYPSWWLRCCSEPPWRPEHVEAQTTTQTQQGPPPAPNAKAPEYAPPAGGAPAGPPAIEPSPGKPSLAPVPGTVDDRGQIRTGVGAWTIFGLRPMTAILVALGLAGLLVLVLGSMARKPARGFPWTARSTHRPMGDAVMERHEQASASMSTLPRSGECRHGRGSDDTGDGRPRLRGENGRGARAPVERPHTIAEFTRPSHGRRW